MGKKTNKKKATYNNKNKKIVGIIFVSIIVITLVLLIVLRDYSAPKALPKLDNKSIIGNLSSVNKVNSTANTSVQVNKTPVIPPSSGHSPLPIEKCTDDDGDNFCVEDKNIPSGKDAGDCDDSNPGIHPGAKEVCDTVDNNCNGLVDEEPQCNAEDCSNGVDDDHDGDVDCFDNECACPSGNHCVNAKCVPLLAPGKCNVETDCNLSTQACINGDCKQCTPGVNVGMMSDSQRFNCPYGNGWYDCEVKSTAGSTLTNLINQTYKCDGKVWSLLDTSCQTSQNCTDPMNKCVSGQCLDCSGTYQGFLSINNKFICRGYSWEPCHSNSAAGLANDGQTAVVKTKSYLCNVSIGWN